MNKRAAKKMLIATTVSATLEAFLLPFARHYREQGWTVDALATGASQSEKCKAAFNSVWDAKWSRTPLDIAGNMESAKGIRRLVDRESYDLVHVHTPVASFVTRAALRKKRERVKVVYTAHGFHFFTGGAIHKNLAFSRLEKAAGRWTDALVVINREDEAAARRHGIVPDSRLFYMPGIGIDLEKYQASTVSDNEIIQLRNELGVTPETRVFLLVAEMIPRKRHEDALRAFAKIGDGAVFLLAGDGPLRPRLERLAAKLGIANTVRFLGMRSDVPALMSMADAVVLVSSQEGLPRSVMEAMAMAKPVIGSNVRGTRDLLANGGGLLAPLGNIESIAYAMRMLRNDKTVATNMGLKGREAVKEYDVRNIIQLHDELYAKILKGDRGVAASAGNP